MTHFLKCTAVATYLLIGMTVSGCSTLSSAFDSVSNAVSGVFQSDEAKK